MSESGLKCETGIARVRRLRWKCRRGMKELDILLETFVQTKEDELVSGGWPQLEQLLALEDDQLWDCLREPGNPEFSGFKSLAEEIHLAQSTNA